MLQYYQSTKARLNQLTLNVKIFNSSYLPIQQDREYNLLTVISMVLTRARTRVEEKP